MENKLNLSNIISKKLFVAALLPPIIGFSSNILANEIEYAHYRGTYEALDAYIQPIAKDLTLYNMAVKGEKFIQFFYSDFDNSRVQRNRACRLANRWVKMSQMINNKSKVRVQIPEELGLIVSKYRNGIKFGRKFKAQKSICTDYSYTDLSYILRLTNELIKLRDSAKKNISKSKYNKVYSHSNGLSFQLKPLPLSLEVLDNSLKLKLDASIGPLRASIQEGISQNKRAKGGIRYLILDVGEVRHIFYVQDLALDLDIVAKANLILEEDVVKLSCVDTCLTFNSVSSTL